MISRDSYAGEVGFGDAQGDWAFALQNLHQLALAVGAAKRAGDDAAVAAFQPQWAYWVGQLRDAADRLYGQDEPGFVVQALDTFSDFSIYVAKAAAGTIQDVGTGIVKTALPALGPLAILAAVAAAFWFFGRKGGPRRGAAPPGR